MARPAIPAPASPQANTKAVTADANPLVDWLAHEGWDLTDPEDLIPRLAAVMVENGIPLYRVRVTLRTLHPQVVGTSYGWERATGVVETTTQPHSIVDTGTYRNSPYAPIFEGAGAIRRRLEGPDAEIDFPVLEELRDAGATDYVALPLLFSDGQINAITIAADRPGGFTGHELGQMYETLPILARRFELSAMRHTARTLLDTYLGPQTGERVLNGLIKRGDGEDIHAVIWFCDLRGSTPLANSMSRREFLDLLNDFFDCMAGAVLDHGGEVLRFIGDAALAIFPTGVSSHGVDRGCCTNEEACHRAIEAAVDARQRIDDLNRRRAGEGKPPLEFGIGLHMGEVTYGNIGVPGRLEFMVVGAAANEAARLEGLTKSLGRSILVSAEFTACHAKELVSLGRHEMRGIDGPREIFTLSDAV